MKLFAKSFFSANAFFLPLFAITLAACGQNKDSGAPEGGGIFAADASVESDSSAPEETTDKQAPADEKVEDQVSEDVGTDTEPEKKPEIADPAIIATAQEIIKRAQAILVAINAGAQPAGAQEILQLSKDALNKIILMAQKTIVIGNAFSLEKAEPGKVSPEVINAAKEIVNLGKELGKIKFQILAKTLNLDVASLQAVFQTTRETSKLMSDATMLLIDDYAQKILAKNL